MLVFTSPCLLLLAVLFQLHHVELLAQGSNGHSDTWKDTTLTKKLKSIISRGDMSELIDMVSDRSIVPPASMSRSADGKGAPTEGVCYLLFTEYFCIYVSTSNQYRSSFLGIRVRFHRSDQAFNRNRCWWEYEGQVRQDSQRIYEKCSAVSRVERYANYCCSLDSY